MGLRDLLQKYENNSGGGEGFETPFKWFSLKDDGDVAVVRFLIKDETDILNFTKEVHRNVKVNDYENSVLCTGESCRFCARGMNPSLRIYIPLKNLDRDELQFWERGLADIKELLNLWEEYKDLDARDYKIKRNGKKGANTTTYSFFPKDREERPEVEEWKSQIPKIVGKNFKYILELTPELQESLIATGRLTFQSTSTDADQESLQRSMPIGDDGESIF